MAQYSFKIFPEIDPELIRWLDSLTRRRRSEEIRKALRDYFKIARAAALDKEVKKEVF